jgi:pyruvate ferredoxin oxidoreductase delta subunit
MKKTKQNISDRAICQPESSLNNKTCSWATQIPDIDHNICIGCSLCVKICPDGTIALIDVDGHQKAEVNYDFCKGCGLCAKECPVKAIRMDNK